MFGNIDDKCKFIQDKIFVMQCDQCMLLGIMGMARTVGLVKYIALHKEFINICNIHFGNIFEEGKNTNDLRYL